MNKLEERLEALWVEYNQKVQRLLALGNEEILLKREIYKIKKTIREALGEKTDYS